MLARSLLFAPANRPDLFSKFPRLKADLFVLDLEDGTPAAERPGARRDLRDSVHTARGGHEGRLFVRINPVGTPDFTADLAAAKESGADGLVLAKTDAAEDVALLRTDLPVIAGIESIRGVVNAESIAASPGIFAVFFGAEDFAAEMNGRRTPEGVEVLYARSRVVLAARVARVRALDQVVLDFRNDAQYRRDATTGRNLGYDGKMCVHPRQIDLANEVFSPTPEEVDFAGRLVAAYDAARKQGKATIDFEGHMVDGPMYKTALATLVAVEKGA